MSNSQSHVGHVIGALIGNELARNKPLWRSAFMSTVQEDRKGLAYFIRNGRYLCQCTVSNTT